MNSEQYIVTLDDMSAIVACPTEGLLPALKIAENREAFFSDEHAAYFALLGIPGSILRDDYRDSPEALKGYAENTYIEAYNMHAKYLAERENDITKLPNMKALREGYESTVKNLKPGQHIALLLMDMTGFKAVNDALGHSRGNDVLTEVGTKMSSTMRANQDVLIHLGTTGRAAISHPHGDEFVALMVVDTNAVDAVEASVDGLEQDTTQEQDAKSQMVQFVRRIESFLSVEQRTKAVIQRFETEVVQETLAPIAEEVNEARSGFATRPVNLGVCVGYTIREGQETLDTLLKRADDMLYKEKDRRRQAEIDALTPQDRAIAELAALAVRAVGFDPDRFVGRVLGEGELSIKRQIQIIEEGMAYLTKNLAALRRAQQQTDAEPKN